MTEANWQRYMADFMVAVRAALPSTVEIVHDVLWYKGDSERRAARPAGRERRARSTAASTTLDRELRHRHVRLADARGLGRARAGARRRRHPRLLRRRRAAPRLFGLATYLLVDNGATAIVNDGSTAPRRLLDRLQRRSRRAARQPLPVRAPAPGGATSRAASCSSNEPYRSTRTVTVPAGYQDLDGVARTSVTLAGGQGAVLVARSARADPDADAGRPRSTPVPIPPAPVAPVAPPRRREIDDDLHRRQRRPHRPHRRHRGRDVAGLHAPSPCAAPAPG